MGAHIDRAPDELVTLPRAPDQPIIAWAGANKVATLTRVGLVDEY